VGKFSFPHPVQSTTLKKKDTSVVCFEYDYSGDGTGESYVSFHPKVDMLSEFDLNGKNTMRGSLQGAFLRLIFFHLLYRAVIRGALESGQQCHREGELAEISLSIDHCVELTIS